MNEGLPKHPIDSKSAVSSNWFYYMRHQALRAFEEKGFPSKSHESWKYTSIGKIDKKGISLAQTNAKVSCQPSLEGSYVVVLVDGKLDAEQSRLPEELSVIALDVEELSTEISDIFQRLYRQEDISEDSATQVALNLAKSTQALLIRIPKGQHIDRVIEVHHILSGNSEGARYTQLWLHQESNSHVTLLERFYGEVQNEHAINSLQNHVSYIQLEKGAHFSHYRLQDTPVGVTHLYTARLTQADHSEYCSFTLTNGASLSRQEIRAELYGKHIRCDQQGVTFGINSQHHDAYLPVVHHQRESYSNQHFRQLLDDQSRGVFYGSVQVPEGSIKTEAHQLNHNILLSPKAQVFTRPELDIFTDDVVCSHGATVGDLDEQALYYLQARGLDEYEAKYMLVKAFSAEIVEDITNLSIRELMISHINRVTSKNNE